MVDPLSFLRLYNLNKKVILERNDKIFFGEYCWPKSVKTNYLVWGAGKEGKLKDYYTLQCLLFLLKNVELPHPSYVEKARAENVPFVRRPDRKKLLAYLNGEINTSESIDKSVPIEIPNTEMSSDIKQAATFVEEEAKEQNISVGSSERLSEEVASSENSAKCIKKETGIEAKEIKIKVSPKIASEEVMSLIRRVKHAIEGQNQQGIVKKAKLKENEDKGEKDQLTACLDVSKESSVTTKHIRSLSDAMPNEMIEAIKAKHLAKKKSKIKVEDDADIRHIFDSIVDVTPSQIIDCGKQWETHANILQSTGIEKVQINSLSTETLESTLTQMQKCCQTLCDNDPDQERSTSFQSSLHKILKPYNNLLEERKRNICKTSTSVLPFNNGSAE